MRLRLCTLSQLSVTVSLACMPGHAPAVATASMPSVAVDILPAPERSAVWEAVLRFHRTHRRFTEADDLRRATDIMSRTPRTASHDRAVVILLAKRQAPLAPYDTVWIRRIRSSSLVAGTCSEPTVTSCPDTALTTYLELSDPVVLGPDSVSVTVWEFGLNPAACPRRDVLVGVQQLSLTLVKRAGEWEGTQLTEQLHATSSCGLIAKRR